MLLSDLGLKTVKINQFAKKGIQSVEDLVRFLPRKYMDFTKETGILPETEISCLRVYVDSVASYNRTIPVLQAHCKLLDTGESLKVTWFHQNYLYNKIEYMTGNNAYVAGKISWNEKFDTYEISGPLLFEWDDPKYRCIKPVYSSITGMSYDYLTDTIKKALSIDSVMEEKFPREIVREYSSLSIKETLMSLHAPASMDALEKAKHRLTCDELLEFAVQNEWSTRNSAVGSPFSIKSKKLCNSLINDLPYELTEDQMKAVRGMIDHVQEGKRTNALVQGDVGCGKTIVAMLMMALFAGSGYQCALMAPTLILAQQHYRDAVAMFEKYGVKVAYLGTDLKATQKKAVIKQIESGEAKIVIGTHSIITDSVKYFNLALVIADEEHKFGVMQREALVKKASSGVHSITMSATPIPRTLAHVVYGNSVQLFTIKTMPRGRKPVITGLATSKEKLYKYIIKQAAKGFQTYVVCPMIEKSEKMDGVKSVNETSEEFRAALEQHGVRIETLTGKDAKEKTAQVLTAFKEKQIDVLIATSVIEVGVNVPTATTIVIMNAERFGLAALHQLRGRVGRGEYQSFCVLDGSNAKEDGIERLNALVNSNNGFDIAKEDLRLRGAGDFLGTKQSGDNKTLALMLAYPDEYKKAQELAIRLIDDYGWTGADD